MLAFVTLLIGTGIAVPAVRWWDRRKDQHEARTVFLDGDPGIVGLRPKIDPASMRLAGVEIMTRDTNEQVKALATTVETIGKNVEALITETKPNGGSTLKDSLNRIESKQRAS